MTSCRAIGALLLLTASAPAAVIRGRVVDAETGRVIPCTVAIRTSAGAVITESPNFRDGFRSAGIFEKDVPAGAVIVTVSRGFDYAAARQELTLKDGERRDLEVRLRRRSGCAAAPRCSAKAGSAATAMCT